MDSLLTILGNAEKLATESKEFEEKILKLVEGGNENNKSSLKAIDTKISEKLDEIYRDNKNFYKELDSSIFLRLEKYIADIKSNIKENNDVLEKNILKTIENPLEKIYTILDNKVKNLNGKLVISISFSAIIILLNIFILLTKLK